MALSDSLSKAKDNVMIEFMKRNSRVGDVLVKLVEEARAKPDVKAQDVADAAIPKLLEAASVLPIVGSSIKPLLAEALDAVKKKFGE